jgi:capsular exopolysaccharide synthesis family protein
MHSNEPNMRTDRQPLEASSPLEAFAFLWQGRRLIVAAAAGGLLLGLVAAASRGTTWRVHSLLHVQQPTALLGQPSGQAGDRAALAYANQQATVLRSTPVLGAALDRGLAGSRVFGGAKNELIWLKEHIDVRVGEDDELLSVGLESALVDEACRVVNAVVESYREQHARLRREAAAKFVERIREEIVRVENDWRREQDALLAFRRNNPGVSLDQEARTASAFRFQELNGALTKAQLAAIDAEDALKSARRIAASPAGSLALHTDVDEESHFGDGAVALGSGALADVELLREKRARMLLEVTPTHPAIIELDQEIAGVVGAWVAALEQNHRAAIERVEDLRQRVLDEELQILALDPLQAQHDALANRVGRAAEVADTLYARMREVDVNGGTDDPELSTGEVTVYETAAPASAVVATSKMAVIAILTFLGGVFGVCAALLASILGLRASSDAELDALVPLLARVPEIPGPVPNALDASARSAGFAAAMRSLLASLDRLPDSGHCKSLHVTSARTGEGKSLIAGGLALAAARAGYRTLIVDADLANPSQGGLIPAASRLRPDPAVTLVEATTEEFLHVLPSHLVAPGARGPLAASDLTTLLEHYGSYYDLIVVDSPACSGSSDAMVIAAKCDRTLLVVGNGQGRASELERATRTITAAGGRVAGAVQNEAPSRPAGRRLSAAVASLRSVISSHMSPVLRCFLASTFLLLGAGCSSPRYELDHAELQRFRAAGPVTPELDSDEVVRGLVAGGPYRLAPGDLLAITAPPALFGEVPASAEVVRTLRVDAEGKLWLPTLSEGVAVAGRTVPEFEAVLVQTAYPQYLRRRPTVVARIAEFATLPVAVFGAVESPGIHELRSDRLSLYGALTAAGGIIKSDNLVVGASMIRVIRPAHAAESSRKVVESEQRGASGPSPSDAIGRAQLAAHVEVDGTTTQPPSDADPTLPTVTLQEEAREELVLPVKGLNVPFSNLRLAGGETIEVVRYEPDTFTVVGLVTSPGAYEYPPETALNLMQAIATSGGTDVIANPPYATIFRKDASGEILPATFRIRGDGLVEASGLLIKPGDVIVVDHTAATWTRKLLAQVVSLQFGLFVDSRGNN